MIRKRMRRLATGLLVTGLLTGSGAWAQNAFMMDGGAFTNAMMQPQIYDGLRRNMELARGKDWGKEPPARRLASGFASGDFDPQGMDRGRSNASGTSVSRTNTSTIVKPVSASRMPAMLAQAYPEAARPQAERNFKQLLAGYHQIEQRFGVPRYDVAGAVAALLVGSWMAYHQSDFPDEHFAPLVQQMRGIIRRNPDFAAADAQQKQEMYEQLAILGMLTATTQMALKENPDAPNAERAQANLSKAGKGYLEEFLKTDASRVQFTARGLELR
ncbi:hypothetical protein MW290_00920 [Aquincola tertiaricarbonis]|uniref:Uncharacterized protein n=1 Tax=Aquincola tertiaricarbonis TaxID=391953 RepID=A0ABY4S7D7_AQUTE|nr:DUF6683 family protein [Aquincola tertiaricarbonis]URI07220.1 hypothetical protein MW290_00920 [Aquincola tertiaricarbonis]